MNRHLSEIEFTDALLGMAEPEAQAHLSACATCREELERVGESIALVRHASTEWSRQQVAALPMIQKPGLFERLRFGARPAMGAAVAAALAVAIAVPLVRSHRYAAPVEEAVVVEHHAPTLSADQLEADNALLSDINQEINQAAAVQQAAYYAEEQSPGKN